MEKKLDNETTAEYQERMERIQAEHEETLNKAEKLAEIRGTEARADGTRAKVKSEDTFVADDGVLIEAGKAGSKHILVYLPRQVKPRMGAIRVNPKTDRYMVPKSMIFAYAKATLPDGSTLVVTRYRPIESEMRQRIYDGMVEKGLKVEPLVDRKRKLTVADVLESE